ncbi:efflux RND transporter periplasmic adaptor subunit [Calothrix sp. 336/3]|uniref:efflux RND transporter periplasmic adaptor subunit n=1 Tax=Calothrix sp. 336/3 TaxID=1337936 RepID=UPI0004E3D21B|nr:efflux RND transporter periplasmic adaptor subunit [Calothrix sp. 336/3]AKG22364.1 RND transporter [Calothrix sp. 336/3]
MIGDGIQAKISLKSVFFSIILTKLNLSMAWLVILGIGIVLSSCGGTSQDKATARQEQGDRTTAVDVAVARKAILQQSLKYTGTTAPFRIVSLRSQVEGQLLALNVDVGDNLKQGQVVGQVDDALLKTSLNQAEAELAALKSEVARATNQVSNARTQFERSRLELLQNRADADRLTKLYKQGAIAQQMAEQARTKASTSIQALRAAVEQVRTEQQAVAAAKGRVIAQAAVVDEARERKSYARLTSPINGVVLEKITEPGNLLRPGNEIFKIGDFSRVKVVVEVSELELSNITQGQSVQVLLDAFPDKKYIGTVTRISPAADSTSRLIPVEIVIPNIDGKIGSGLLTRVNFQSSQTEQVVIPELALQQAEEERKPGNNPGDNPTTTQGKVFVVTEGTEKPQVTQRIVKLGDRADSKVTVLSGLEAGEKYVVRSGKPLKDGDTVRLSILSESK